MKALAAVLPARGAALELREVRLQHPRPDELLVRIVACGVCHADTLAQHGDLPFPAPGVLGHEGAGVVEAVGDAVAGFAPGDRVVLSMPWCGHCRHCLAGQPRYCEHVLRLIAGGARLDGTTSLAALDGTPLHSHFFGQSAFASHCLVRANQAVQVGADVDLETLGHVGCGVATGAGAVWNVLRPEPGSSLVVFGAGTVGLAAIMAARNTGATRIVAVDRHPARLALARELGATDTIDASGASGADTRRAPTAGAATTRADTSDLAGLVREACGGPADRTLECTGNLDVLRAAVDSLGMLGVCGLVGGAPAGAELTLDHHSTMIGKRVVGIHGGEGRSPELIGGILELQRQGRFPLDRLVTTFPLADVNDAMAAAHHGDVVKPVLLTA